MYVMMVLAALIAGLSHPSWRVRERCDKCLRRCISGPLANALEKAHFRSAEGQFRARRIAQAYWLAVEYDFNDLPTLDMLFWKPGDKDSTTYSERTKLTIWWQISAKQGC